MAKTVVPIELSSTPGIVDNSNATAITIDSSEDVTLAGHIVLADSKIVKLGTGADLQLYHDGSHSYINNSTGNLAFDVAGDFSIDADGGDIVFNDGGSEIGRFTNSSSDFVIKTATQDKDLIFKGNDGGSVITALTLDYSDAGTASFNHDIKLGDSSEAIFGASTDLRIAHDSTDSFMTNNTGDLYFNQLADDKDILFRSDDGAGGITTYFRLDGSAATHDGSNTTATYTKFPDNSYLTLGTGDDLQIYHDGSYSYIKDAGTGDLRIQASTNVQIYNSALDKQSANFHTAGPVTLYYDNAAKFATSSSGVTVTGEVAATSLDISGDADIDGTLEADAITVNGSTLASVIAGTTVTLASTVTVSDSTANTNFPVVFHNESNALLDDTGALRYNPSTGTLLVPNLSVAGTTTTVDTVTMEAQNAIIFEGATADGNETTLSIVDPTADHTQYLINQGGYIPVLAAATTTAITSTPAELNLLDGSTANTVVNSKAVVYGSSGELAGTLSTAAQTNITSVGTLTTLTVDDITINGSTISDAADLSIDVGADLTLDAGGGDIILSDDGTIVGTLSLNNNSGDFYIRSRVQDKSMLFRGNDDGTEFTALTIDMADAGTATFNHDIKLGDDSELVLGAGSDLKFYHSSNVNYIKTNSDLPLKIWDAGGAGILEMTPNGKVGIFHNGSEKIYTTSTGAVIAHNSDTDYSATAEPAGILTLYNSNGSDGAGVNNYSSLEFNTGDGATSQGFINYVRTADNQGKFTFSQRTGSSSYAEAVVIDNSGNLDVAGIVDGTNFKINGAQGSDGQVLTSTGSGVAWEDASGGLATSGGTLTGNLAFGDDLKIKMGDTNEDFEIYHIGGSVNVVRGTNAMVLQSDDYISLGTHSGGELMLKATKNGAVDIYHDNVIQASTTSTGFSLPTTPMFDAGRNAGYQTDDAYFVQDYARVNVGSHFDTSTGKFTAPRAGTYFFTFSIMTHDSGSVVQAVVQLRKNGSAAMNFLQHKTGAYHTRVNGSMVLTLAANDYIQTYVGDSGTSSGWQGSAHEYNVFSGFLIG